MRVINHPILGEDTSPESVSVTIDGQLCQAKKGEMIAATLLANGFQTHRYTAKRHEPRGIYCGIGQCTDCVMTVNGVPNVRTCITEIAEGMVVETQEGFGFAGKQVEQL